ncbi:hypothetical protein EV643_12415 [Kribbella sp. VKM Ac-2527]|uniref:F5/8 type C domain-containing protein n=1 Tax=Kribbella caucasensis TaxID=2512215 RepID=A0A4R6JGN7_9ACTN|nr:hypothetical protein [Kribbella sp. VKM Ac-2527]TDO35129.1 hypothetical protein EV643_12415 [Kribbella sp. VKM Ac-2527]
MTSLRTHILRALVAALILMVSVQIAAPTEVEAETGTPIGTGSYVYDQAPNGGASPDRANTGLVALSEGALTDGSTGTGAQWIGDGQLKYKQVSIVFDLHRDYPLARLTLISNAPNRYYGIASFSVRVRPEADPDFTAVHAQAWYGTAVPLPQGTALNHSVTVELGNRSARFVIVTIARLHEYQHLPLNEISLIHGSGDAGVDPAPPLSATELIAQTTKPVKQIPRDGMVDVGNYYAGVAPDDGVPDKTGGLIGFQYGALFDRRLSDGAGWRGHATAPKNVTVVFDLLRDQPLERITIFSKAPNQFWAFDEVAVTYRPESSATYRVAGRAVRARTDLDYRLDIPMGNKTARFVRVELTRNNQYLHIPLSEVEFAIGGGPVGPDPAPPATVDGMREELRRYTRLADEYGQYLYQDWPGKVTSDAQLRDESRQEAERLADVAPDTVRYDRYGGLRALGNHRATGFFRLQKINGRWWFVTPDGHPFFLKGVDSMSDEEWGYGTVYQNPDGSRRDVFDALPDSSRYAGAYAVTERGHVVSFVKSNLMRKYGADYKDAWRDITYRRMLDWSFNAQSKWARDPNIVMPHIDQLTAPSDVVRVLWGIDPFDPEFAAKLDRHFDIRSRNRDPWLIGYFFDNERGWDREVVAEVLRRDSSLPAKRAFVSYLSDAYDGDLTRVNDLLGTNANSFEALAGIAVEIARVPDSDIRNFITEASKAYYSEIQRAIRKQDPHHLFLGSALVPNWRSSVEWIVGGRDHLDAISLDVYTDDASYLTGYEQYDKPVLNLEYSFNTSDRGLRAINAAARAGTVAERGAKYQAFVEAQAASPVFVGSGWFVYYDQAVTGRPGDGESYNFGLLNQQDQPYTEMTDVMRDANLTLELVHHDGTADLTAEVVADSITRLAPVDEQAPRLRLPRLPRQYRLTVVSTDHPDVIAPDGAVTLPPQTTVVTLVLKVTRTAGDTSALTRPLQVRVPAGS